MEILHHTKRAALPTFLFEKSIEWRFSKYDLKISAMEISPTNLWG